MQQDPAKTTPFFMRRERVAVTEPADSHMAENRL
jgi:hypothetical protein